jgi:hypothetical protein
MNDDYDDPDEPGGLWDPDAVSPPPARWRPALQAVPAPDLAENAASSVEPAGSTEETLVRLDQFRPAAEDDASFDGRHRSLLARRSVLAAASVVAAATLGAGALGLEAAWKHAPKPAAGASLDPDVEQAALTRTVEPVGTGEHRSRAGRQGAGQTSTTAHHATTSSKARHGASTHRSASSQVRVTETASTPAVVSPSPPPTTPTRSASAASVAPASATSAEFSFER